MDKMKLYAKCFTDENNTVCQLEYSLVVSFGESGKIFGVGVSKSDPSGSREEEYINGLSDHREEAEQFLIRLADGIALPVELAALCDDYISEKEGVSALEQTAC